MEKKEYQTPTLTCLGSVRELTALTAPDCGSIEVSDASTVDEVCEIQSY